MQNRNNYKGKTNPNKRRSSKKKNYNTKRPEVLSDDLHISDKNDWRFYALNEQLVKDTASFPFGYALGSEINLGPYGADANNGALPGIMELRFAPTVGWSDNPNSPINMISRSIYTDVRRTNSGGTNYDPVDLMIYLVGMDSCYMCLEMMKRAYGVAQLYSPVNRYLPRALVRAMGFDFDSMAANLADFRAAINIYAQKLKSLVIPNGMAYMAKHKWMVSGVYQDHPTDKSQLYVFNPTLFYKFALDSDGAGMLSSVLWAGNSANPVTVTQAISFMNTLLDPLLANQDFAIMSGDILKWRGEGGVVVPTGITETFQVFPSYDESVLDQINNATLVGNPSVSNSTGSGIAPAADGRLEIRQDATKSFLISKPQFRLAYRALEGDVNPGRNVLLSNRFVNFMHDHVEPHETMEATRLTNIARSYQTASSGYDWFNFYTLGSEVLNRALIWQYSWVNGTWTLDYHEYANTSDAWTIPYHSNSMTMVQANETMTNIKAMLNSIQRLASFDRHPMIAYTAALIDSDNVRDDLYAPFHGYMNDINYYTIINEQDIIQMSEVALISEFNVRVQDL